MKKIFYRIFVLVAAAAASASCIYPFDAVTEFTEGSELLVVEGDIMVGDYTVVRLSNVVPLQGNYDYETVKGMAWVEDEKGNVYGDNGAYGQYAAHTFRINTTMATPDRKYRLCINADGKDYHTGWMSPNPAPVLDRVDYELTDDDVVIRLSTHSDDGAQYFRWSYDEVWKYHADYPKQYEFDPETQVVTEMSRPDLTYYWCYNEHSSTEVELCATTDLNSNALVDHSFLTFSRSSNKVMTRYKITTSVRTISPEAYRFLYTLKVNSNFVGSLFSPNPSDVRGNVVCEQNPDEYVVGYVDCCSPSVQKSLYIDATGVYIKPRTNGSLFYPEIIEGEGGEDIVDLLWYWKQGNVPVTLGIVGTQSGVLWGPRRCIECQAMGGHLYKPLDFEE